jgi:hypothetical protein
MGPGHLDGGSRDFAPVALAPQDRRFCGKKSNSALRLRHGNDCRLAGWGLDDSFQASVLHPAGFCCFDKRLRFAAEPC